jgi:hypothetical protein
MTVIMAMTIFCGCRLRRSVPAEVMMVMAMRRRYNHRLWNAALFAQLRFRRHFVVVLGASPLLVGDEAPE